MLKTTSNVCRSDASGPSKPTLRELFETEESPLLRYTFSLTGRRAVAEEIVQEAFLKLHADWHTVEHPKAWLYRTVRNRAISHLRTDRREVANGDEMATAASSSTEAAPPDLLLRMESIGILRETIAALDPADRQLIELKYYAGLKYTEISSRTGLSVSNVGYRLHHILKSMADKLRPLGFDGIS